MEFKRRLRKRAKIPNLTSLTDVIFLLVIFFMLTTGYEKFNLLNLNMAKIGEENNLTSIKDGNILVISLSDNNYFVFEKNHYKIIELKKFIDKLSRNKQVDKVMIITNENINVQELVNIMDIIKSLGINNIIIGQNS